MVGYDGNTSLVNQMVGAGDRNITIPEAAVYSAKGDRLWESNIKFVKGIGFRMQENGYDTPVREIDRPEGEVCPYAFQVVEREPMLSRLYPVSDGRIESIGKNPVKTLW